MTYTTLRNLALSILEENTATPRRWTEDEIEFFINSALEWLSEYHTGWVFVVTDTIGVASDTYAIDDNVLRVNEVKLKLTTDTEWPDTSLVEKGLPFLEIDGKQDRPTYFGVSDSSDIVNSNLTGIVFYPAPDITYDIRIAYNYHPVLDKTTPNDTVPIPAKFNQAIVFQTCAGLMSKLSVNKKGQNDSDYYSKLALQSISSPMKNDVNRQAANNRGYYEGSSSGAWPLGN